LIYEGFMYITSADRKVTITQSGWMLRDELLRRKALVALLENSIPNDELHQKLGTKAAEADQVRIWLFAHFLVELVIIDRGNGMRLTSAGRVKADRLSRAVW
jgi:hypothetical protein